MAVRPPPAAIDELSPVAQSAALSQYHEQEAPDTAMEPLEPEDVLAGIEPANALALGMPTTNEGLGPGEALEKQIAALPPAGMSITGRERIFDYVASYDAGGCSLLMVGATDDNYAEVVAFGSAVEPFVVFDKAFTRDNQFEPDLRLEVIAAEQCPLIDALHGPAVAAGSAAVSLDQTVIQSGSHVSGRLKRRETPRATDSQPELYVIDDAGQIHDGRPFVQPEASRRDDAGWQFSFPVTMVTRGAEAPALVLTIWGRPETQQPSQLRPGSPLTIDALLREAETYSLSAFKVVR